MNPLEWNTEVVKAWGPIIVGLSSVLITLFIQSRQNRTQNNLTITALLSQKQSQRREEIVRQLTEFYGPIRELKIQSRILYDKFALDIKKNEYDQNRQFRTLTYIAQHGTANLSKTDATLLDQIVDIAGRCLTLIENEAGIVDRPALRELLGQWGAHIRLLQLASSGKLSGVDSKLFEDIVYPRAIDGAIESAILRLEFELRELVGMNGTDLTNTNIQDGGDLQSIDYYDIHNIEYRNRTLHTQLDHLWGMFTHELPRGGRILDAGCGVGRDTRHFIESGYLVVSVDASKQMVAMCREYPHSFCIHMHFGQLSFFEEFDGIWCCASLVHAPYELAKGYVSKFERALKPGGTIFISMKYSPEIRSDRSDGRVFYYYNENALKSLLADNALVEVRCWRNSTTSQQAFDQNSVEWVNILAKKKEGYPG